VYPPLVAAGRVAAHLDGARRWWEFSTVARYLDLHVRAHAEGFAPDVVLSPGASIAEGARVARAVLWPGARVEAGATVVDSVLGEGVAVRAGEEVRGAAVVRADLAGAGGDAPAGERWGERIRVSIPRPA
jgi:NDP-sugar pyrophosphorylase family protein